MAVQKVGTNIIDSDYTTTITTNPQLSGTESMLVPKGTTAQRPSSPVVGQFRYNTTLDALEQYTSVGWSGISPPPTIISISPTTFSGESGTSITITGTNYSAGAIVKFISNSGTEYTATTTTFVSSTELTATTPEDFTVAQEPFDIKVTNPNNLSVTLADALDCGGSPTWTTASGSVGSVTCNNAASGISIAATDPDSGGSIASYAVASGALPSGLSLNSSTGAITGTAPALVSSTSYSFTGRATDNAGNTSDRSFSLTVAPITGLTAGRASGSMTGGTSWFSCDPAYYGVEDSATYKLVAGEKVNQFVMRDGNSSTNGRHWFVVFEGVTGQAAQKKIVAAWKFDASGSAGTAVTYNASSALATVGTLLTGNVFITPAGATYGDGNYYVGWVSSDTRDGKSKNSAIYVEYPEGGGIPSPSVDYVTVSSTGGYPDQVGAGATITMSAVNTGQNMHIGFYGT